MEYKLVALDIDGTLLNSNHELPIENITIINKLVNKNINFVLVTGRPDTMALKYAKQLNIKPIILGYNGATVRNLDTKELFEAKFIDISLVKTICKLLEECKVYFRIYCMDCIYSFNNWEFDESKNIYAVFSKLLLQYMDFKILDTIDDLAEPVVKVVAFSETPEELLNIKDKFKGFSNLNVVFGSKNGLDINAYGANKGKALLKYASDININPEEIIAIGDSENDLSMLEVVGMPITLENGSNYLKERVKFITKSNDDAGVAYALRHFFKDKL